MAYFDTKKRPLLVKWHGEVPLTLIPSRNQSSNNLGPSTFTAIYDTFIIGYQDAKRNLPEITDPNYVQGRANKYAAHGLLARIYLKMPGHPMNTNLDTTLQVIMKRRKKTVTP